MRILFVVPYVPNLVRVRPHNLIRHLAARGHAVTVLTLWTTEGEQADAEALRQHCHRVVARPLHRWRSIWNCLRALPTRVPLQAVYCWQPALAWEIAYRLSPSATRHPPSATRHSPSATRHSPSATRHPPYDVIHVEHLRGARYGLYLKSLIPVLSAAEGSNLQYPIPIIWDSVDCISYLFEQAARDSRSLKGRLMTRLELERTRRYEAWLVHQFDRVLVTSDVDRQAFLALLREEPQEIREKGKRGIRVTTVAANTQSLISNIQSPISVLPNGVDLDYFTPSDEPREPATLIITGKMSYHANVTAVLHLVHDIMPLVWRERPDVQVWTVGKDPPREIRRLQLTIDNSQLAINVTGTVPDIRPYLRRATLAVAPVPYGAGIQNKVLEAMACGTPVVASPQAIAALSAQPGRDLMLADDAAAFARAVLDLLDDVPRRAQLGQAGRAYVEQHHSWDAIAGQLERVYYEETVVGRLESQHPPAVLHET